MQILKNGIDNTGKILPHNIEDNIDIHTPLMRSFLKDLNDNCGNYADGMSSLEDPLPVSFSWSSGSHHYILKVSEHADMSAPLIFETEKTSYDVYNLKVGTRYYWAVGHADNGIIYTSDTRTFTTLDLPPRNLRIGGIGNARDIGGWKTSNGKKVKQGLVYRTSALDGYEDGATVEYLTPDGRNIMKNLLGIKTEIDLRIDHETEEGYPPEEKTSSVLGSDVKYYHCPILLGPENYLNSVSSLKTIFGVLADPASYPVTYHCAVGADRTGMITYTLNGLLGVSREDLVRDYLLTNFSYQQKYRPPLTIGYVEEFDNYTGVTLQEKICNYLAQKIGVSLSDLDFIIAHLTE